MVKLVVKLRFRGQLSEEPEAARVFYQRLRAACPPEEETVDRLSFLIDNFGTSESDSECECESECEGEGEGECESESDSECECETQQLRAACPPEQEAVDRISFLIDNFGKHASNPHGWTNPRFSPFPKN